MSFLQTSKHMSGEQTPLRQLGAYLLALALGLTGALLLAHFAACEADESFACLFRPK